MLDVGNIVARVRETIDVVEETVTQAASSVARFFGAGDVQASPTQADTALHNVAAQVNPSIRPGERESIERGVDAVFQRTNYGYNEAAIELAKQLRGQSTEYRMEFMRRFYETSPPVASDILRGAAGGNRHYVGENFTSQSDKQIIATTLGETYDCGMLPSNFVEQLLRNDSMRMPPNNEFTGTIVGMSGSRDLINAYVDRSLQMAKGTEPQWVQSFNLGAARAMAGDPQVLQERLAGMKPEELRDFLSKIEPHWHDTKIGGYDSGYHNALSTFIRGAARIEPPTEEVLNLFREVASANYFDRSGVTDAMSELFLAGYEEHFRLPNGRVDETVFHSNSQFLLQRMLATGVDPTTGADIDEAGQTAALRNFFQAAAFGDNSNHRDAVRAQITDQIRSIQTAINNYPAVDSRTRSLIERTIQPEPGVDPVASVKEQLAFRLGRLTATAFQGFEAAVKARNGENAAIDGAVDFLFGLVPVGKATEIIKSRVPGAGVVIDKASDKGIDTLKNIVKDWMHKADLEKQRLEVWNLFSEFANNVQTYHSDDFYSGAGSVDYTLQHSGR